MQPEQSICVVPPQTGLSRRPVQSRRGSAMGSDDTTEWSVLASSIQKWLRADHPSSGDLLDREHGTEIVGARKPAGSWGVGFGLISVPSQVTRL